jgi:hypothetical protein
VIEIAPTPSHHFFFESSTNSQAIMEHQSADTFTVRQAGAYRNLPTYLSVSGLTAIVPGAKGISGWNTIRVLLDSIIRWNKIYAMSRSPPSKELTDLLSLASNSRAFSTSLLTSWADRKILREPWLQFGSPVLMCSSMPTCS